MHVLILSTALPPDLGGLGAHVYRLATGLAVRGHGVDVALKRARRPEEVAQSQPFEVSWQPSAMELRRLVARAHIVHLNGFWMLGAGLALAAGRPLVWMHHEYDTSCPIGLGWYRGRSTSFAPARCARCMVDKGLARQIPRRFLMLPLRRAVARRAHANVLPTHYVAGRLCLPRSRVIAYGVESGSPPRPRAAEQAERRFAYFGRLASSKGCDILLDAVSLATARGRRLRLDFYGEGPERAALERLTASHGLEGLVSFHGEVPLGGVQSRMATAMALVIPSVWDEVAGIVALEAMATGTPIIASRVGGLAEVVGQVGLLVERASADALCSAMCLLADDMSLRRRLAQAGRERWSALFDSGRMLDRHEELFAELRMSATPAAGRRCAPTTRRRKLKRAG